MKRYTVFFDRDETGAWIAQIPELKGCHTWGRTLDHARRMIRDALAVWLDDPDDARDADLREVFRLPKNVQSAVGRARVARAGAEKAQVEARFRVREAVRLLMEEQRLPLRDVAAILGLSYQRVHQLTQNKLDRLQGRDVRLRPPVISRYPDGKPKTIDTWRVYEVDPRAGQIKLKFSDFRIELEQDQIRELISGGSGGDWLLLRGQYTLDKNANGAFTPSA